MMVHDLVGEQKDFFVDSGEVPTSKVQSSVLRLASVSLSGS